MERVTAVCCVGEVSGRTCSRSTRYPQTPRCLFLKPYSIQGVGSRWDAQLLHSHGGMQFALHGAIRRMPVGMRPVISVRSFRWLKKFNSRVEGTVLTGGEPLMFPGLVELKRRRVAGCHVTVETAGTPLLPLTCDLLSCSPNCPTAHPPRSA